MHADVALRKTPDSNIPSDAAYLYSEHICAIPSIQIQVVIMGSNDLVSLSSANGNTDEKVIHVVMLPWLAKGHILPYSELAKILAQRGHFVTFINTPKNIDHIPKTPKSLEPFIKMVRLPLPCIQQLLEGVESTMDIPHNMYIYHNMAFQGLQDDVTEILKTSKPDWVFYDFTSAWLPSIAKSLNIPCAHFSVIQAWDICFFDPPDHIKSDINIEAQCGPPKWVSFNTTIHLRSYEIIRTFKDFQHQLEGSIGFHLHKAYSSCDMFLFKSSRELEGEWLDYVSEAYKVPVISVGLFPPSMQIRDVEEEDNNPDWVKINEWLNTRESSSVVYIGFGSELKLSQEDLTELAYGIELSGLSFFWSLKYLKEGSIELPKGFEDRTKDRGIVRQSWAPQLKILAHGAIGGCLCHCGANSSIEMLSFGHVLVTLPYLVDQCLFSRALVEKELAIEVPRSEKDGSFTRDSVAHKLKLAIVEDEGSTYRNNAKEMGKVFSSKDLHNQYIDNFIDALKKYGVSSDD